MRNLLSVSTDYTNSRIIYYMGENDVYIPSKTIYGRNRITIGQYKLTKGLKEFDYKKIMNHPVLAFIYNVGDSYTKEEKPKNTFDKQQVLRAIDFWIGQVAYMNEVDYVMTGTVDIQDETLLRELIETRDWILKQKSTTKFCKNPFEARSTKSRLESFIQQNQEHQLKEYCDSNRYVEWSEAASYDEVKSRRGEPFCHRIIRMSSRKYARAYKKKWEKESSLGQLVAITSNPYTIVVNGANENFQSGGLITELYTMGLEHQPQYRRYGGLRTSEHKLGLIYSADDISSLQKKLDLLGNSKSIFRATGDDVVTLPDIEPGQVVTFNISHEPVQSVSTRRIEENPQPLGRIAFSEELNLEAFEGVPFITTPSGSDWQSVEMTGTVSLGSPSDDELSIKIPSGRRPGDLWNDGLRYQWNGFATTSGTIWQDTGTTFWRELHGYQEYSPKPKGHFDDNGVLLFPEQVPGIVDTMLIGKKISSVKIFARRSGTPWPNQKKVENEVNIMAKEIITKGIPAMIRAVGGMFQTITDAFSRPIMIPLTLNKETRQLKIEPVSVESELLIRQELQKSNMSFSSTHQRDGPTTIKVNGEDIQVKSIEVLVNH